MPLFVPILRLALLFLNIYESYKMLKPPALSARNGGRPTQRALQQRKRDMKGCLAVWIVWSCLATYERFFESIISLFIPFYAEFKSLALLFLILTRARGAEPIYLHVIRPFLKPYTPALDSAFDLFHMIGDFLFALAMYPLRLVWEQWQASFYTYSYTSDVLESESDNAPAHPPPDWTRMNTIPDGLPQSASSFADLGIGRPEGVKFPKKVNSDRPHGSRHTSGESSRNVSRSQKAPEASPSQV
ncbi:hypothetical protein BDQ12DRAFT_596897 [Crucibulum laeve]|uniref:Protein YOP1 n=1 Tax=Crucibulum laeve TaxID=68775 RepID=A0A5C3MER9_9AGAR|nr:hypothetical protein BDQ12DRAFT_596897 [Crucibulum laeve]